MKYFFLLLTALFFLVVAVPVSAHVTLNPKKLEPGWQQVNVRVPTEGDAATTQVRLVVPDGADIVSFGSLTGWTVQKKRAEAPATAPTVSDATHEDEESSERITEVTWTGGRIGVGEYQDFPIMIKVGDGSDKLTWKAYQTYADGEVVNWDGTDDKHPAPIIEVVKGAVTVNEAQKTEEPSLNSIRFEMWLSVAAFLFSLIAIMRTLHNSTTQNRS